MDNKKQTKKRYVDEYLGLAVQLKLWRGFSILLILAIFPLSFVIVRQSFILDQASRREQVVLSPAVSRFDVVSPGKISKSFIKAAFSHVAYRNSSWTYESISDNYQDLFDHYYSEELETKIRANLEITQRFDHAKKSQMVSIYKVDHEKSEFEWCEAQNMACGIVVGKETLFIHHNQPYRSKEVSYLIFAKMIYPTKTNPFSLKITRIVVGDYEPLKKALQAAKKGELPDEINMSDH